MSLTLIKTSKPNPLNHYIHKYISCIKVYIYEGGGLFDTYVKTHNNIFRNENGDILNNDFYKYQCYELFLSGEVEEERMHLMNLHTLVKVDLTNLNTNNVTDMSCMFSHCDKLQDIDFGNINTSNVRDMSFMFHSCISLKFIDIRKFDTRNVVNMKGMFRHCLKLESLLFNDTFVTSRTRDISSMFLFCKRLKILNLASFDVTNISDISCLFYECNNLKNLILFKDDKKFDNIEYMFYNCNKLFDITNIGFVSPNILHAFDREKREERR